MELFAQYLEVVDERVDFLDRARRDALKQRADVVGYECSVVVLRAPRRDVHLAANKFSDLPFHLDFGFSIGLSFGWLRFDGLTLEDTHARVPHSSQRQNDITNSATYAPQ